MNFAALTKRIKRHFSFEEHYKRIRKIGMRSSAQGTSHKELHGIINARN